MSPSISRPKPDPTCILASRAPRILKPDILYRAVAPTSDPEFYDSPHQWRAALSHCDMRLQWLPNCTPRGDKTRRRAIQLHLSGETPRRFATQSLSTKNTSPFVQQQKLHAHTELQTPHECSYSVTNPATTRRLRIELLDTRRADEKDAL